jgi:cysteine desulfurase
MHPFFTEKFGNTMTLYKGGREAKEAVESARAFLARMISARPSEIIFTSCATESNNFALKGAALANKEKGNHIILSSLEHESVRNCAPWLEKFGFTVSFLPVGREGFFNVGELERMMTKDTILVSVMHASNEVGTIQPIEKVGKLCRKKNVLFHTDAVQSFGKIPIDVRAMNIDILSASSHKIYGPKGAALLYIKEGVNMERFLDGGSHEGGRRAGTLQVPSIVGFAKAAELCAKEMERESARQIAMRDMLISNVLSRISQTGLIGARNSRLCNHASFWIEKVSGEDVVFALDQQGMSVGTGAACASIRVEPSEAVLALGLSRARAQSSVRITLGRDTRRGDIIALGKALKTVVDHMRKNRSQG